MGDMAQNLSRRESADEFRDMPSQVENGVRRVTVQGREIGEHVREAVESFKSSVDRSVSNQPMLTLAIAAVIGLALGALWKSRRNAPKLSPFLSLDPHWPMKRQSQKMGALEGTTNYLYEVIPSKWRGWMKNNRSLFVSPTWPRT